jgi:hypothetical protein
MAIWVFADRNRRAECAHIVRYGRAGMPSVALCASFLEVCEMEEKIETPSQRPYQSDGRSPTCHKGVTHKKSRSQAAVK